MDTREQSDHPRVARTRAHALEVTLELAAECGLHACTFDAVSERSGISRSTLYRHWSNKAELLMDALSSQTLDSVVPDTGSLRDDMLNAMLGLGWSLENKTWGAMLPQLVAAASTDPELSAIHRDEYYMGLYAQSIERAKRRGEVPKDIDSNHATELFVTPIFYRYLIARRPIDARWITSHVDKTVALFRHRDASNAQKTEQTRARAASG